MKWTSDHRPLTIAKILCLLGLFLSVNNISFAQTDTTKAPSMADTVHHPDRPYTVLQFIHETHLLVKQPLTWKKRQWLTVAGATAAIGLSTLLDQPMRESTQGEQNFYHSAFVEGGRLY